MVDVTIKNASGVTFTFEQGEAKSVDSATVADIEQTALPLSGPLGAFIFDFNGSTKVIMVKGVLWDSDTTRTSTGDTKTILEQKQWLETTINGQQSAVEFTSDFDSQTYDGSSFANTTVAVGRVRFRQVEGEPEFLQFEMDLVVGT